MVRLKSVYILLFISETFSSKAPLVEISNGWLQGKFDKSYSGHIFSLFEGIPYARPPIGNLRFEPPQESQNWTGTWIANTQYTCLHSQIYGNVTTISGSEDCLYLNVYVPRKYISLSDNLPVIVHIHGGGFTFGSGHFYSGPRYLMDKEVIFVTMNYRLGPFGFLTTQDDVVPGNNGLKDQSLSLKWIQKNIKYFGGNPGSVTLTGMSAGGASVHLHYFSTLSKGLFHRGLSQSGAALNPWVIKINGLERTKRLASVIGCPTKKNRKMVDCLKSRSGDQLVKALVVFQEFLGFPPIPFGPVIEAKHDNAFLIEHPHKMLIDKTVTDIPWLTTAMESEGTTLAYIITPDIFEILRNFDENAHYILDYNDTVQESSKSSVAKEIRKYYLKERGTLEDVLKVISDRYFIAGIDTSAKLQARANKSPVHSYLFGYRGEASFADFFIKNTKHIGPSHGDDVFYYLHNTIAKEKLSESDEKMKSIFLETLVAYATDQKLQMNGVAWTRVQDNEALEYLHIKSPNDISMEAAEDFGSNSFWRKLPLLENEHYKMVKDEL